MTEANATAVDLTTTPTSPAHAQELLDTLRGQRIADLVTDLDWSSRADYLGRIAAGEANVAAPPEPYASPDEQLERSWQEAMAPAKSGDYELPPIADPNTGAIDPDVQALDSQIREALSAGGVPKMWGGPICEIAGELLTKFERSSADEIGAHTAKVGESLRAEWGGEYDASLAEVSELLAEVAEKHPVVGALLDEAPHAFADVRLMGWLVQVARNRR